MGNCVQVCCRCFWSHSGLETADHPGIMVATFFQPIFSQNLGHIDDRSPEVGREEELCAAEVRRSNADDGEGMLVDLDGAANHIAIAVEIAVPEGVTQNDLRHAVLAVLL